MYSHRFAKHRKSILIAITFAVSVVQSTALAQIGESADYVDETSTRLVADPSVGLTDPNAKSYAWGDVDGDGDTDLVCVRKQPYNTTGLRRNVLFMNEGLAEGHAIDGVLIDRTVEFASDADDGGQGFLDPTNDRDVVLVDLNNDSWLDMVTTTTYGQGLPKTISHPRIYMNKGEVGGVWQGFRYEEGRTPTMPIAPNFCGIGYGDVSGDGFVDLYHIDYNNDLEDRLWINDGTGSFDDQSFRMTFEMLESEFGVHAVIADMNGDGAMDVVKNRANGAPYRISIAYNDPDNEGFFDQFQVVYSGSPYYVEVADLNNDGLLDLVTQDDFTDRYFINQGNNANGIAQLLSVLFPPQSNGFEGTIELGDLNNDGFIDVLVADETVNGVGVLCSRELRIWHNQGNVPNVSFVEDSGGIPLSARTGTFDVAAMDINGDDWLDLVIGTCSGTSVWIRQPPVGVSYIYPGDIPALVSPNGSTEIAVEIEAVGGTLDPASPQVHVSVDGGAFAATPLTLISGNLYTASLGVQQCLDRVRFYFGAQHVGGAIFNDPPDAPASTYLAIAAAGTMIAFEDDVEGDISQWQISSDPSLVGGAWEQADPNGTALGPDLAAPDDDAQPEPENTMAFVTQNGVPGGSVTVADVDWGPTYLVSPTFDLAGTDAVVSWQQWFFCDDVGAEQADFLTIEVSNNGGTDWVQVAQVTDTDEWEAASFVVGDFVMPTSDVRVRFSTADVPNNSVTEAGIDVFVVERFACVACEGTEGCDDNDACTQSDACISELCVGTYAQVLYADINSDSERDLDDLLCLLDGLSGLLDCPGVSPEDLDIAPCVPDGDLNLGDLIAMLDAVAGSFACDDPCP